MAGRILVVVLGLIVTLVILRMGPLARRGTRSDPLFSAEHRTAAEYRAVADAAAARQDWSTAVIERYTAMPDARPGARGLHSCRASAGRSSNAGNLGARTAFGSMGTAISVMVSSFHGTARTTHRTSR